MNGPTLALHGRAAATIVHLAGDPTVRWADAAKAARTAENEPMAVLFEGVAAFTVWCQQFAELLADSTIIEPGENLPPPGETPEVPDD